MGKLKVVEKDTNHISLKQYARPLVSIILPVYNGEKFIKTSLEVVYNYMNSLGIPFEIIVVNDGSIDDTLNNIIEASSIIKNIKVYSYTKNLGKGFAFIYGAKRSSGHYVVLFDSDLDIPVEQIPFMIVSAEKTKCDIIITNKWMSDSIRKWSLTRKILSRGFNLLMRGLTGLKLRDTQTGAKLIRRSSLYKITRFIFTKRYAFDVELLLVAKQRGMCIKEVPPIREIKLDSRFSIKEIVYMLIDLLSITYRHRVSKRYRRRA